MADLEMESEALGTPTEDNVGEAGFVEAVRPSVQVLIALAEGYDAVVRAAGGLPHADSPGMQELAEQEKLRNDYWLHPIDNAHMNAALMTSAGMDHLRSYALLFRSAPTPTYSHLVVARAALVAFAAAGWLAEPGIGATDRVKRSLVLVLHDAENRKRYGLQELRDQGATIIEDVRQGAKLAGWEVSLSKKRVGGVGYPDPATAIGAVIGPAAPPRSDGTADPTSRLVWSYLSGVAHGYTFPLMQSMQVAPQRALIDGLVRGNLMTSSQSVHVMAQAITSASITACGRFVDLMGWGTSGWLDVRGQAGAWMHSFTDTSPVTKAGSGP